MSKQQYLNGAVYMIASESTHTYLFRCLNLDWDGGVSLPRVEYLYRSLYNAICNAVCI
jgi:hypothetical protein